MTTSPPLSVADRLVALPKDKRKAFFLKLLEEGGSLASLPIARLHQDEEVQLSFEQERLAILDQLDPDACDYVLYQGFRISGMLDVDVLIQVFENLIQCHSSLRIQIDLEKETLTQRIRPHIGVPLTVHNLSGDQFSLLENAAVGIASKPIPLAEAPLFRIDLLTNDGPDQLLLLRIHHVIADGLSLAILFRQAMTSYDALVRGQALEPIKAERASLVDFANWQRSWSDGMRASTFATNCAEAFHSAPVQSMLPPDQPAPTGSITTQKGRRLRRLIDPSLTQKIEATSRSAKTGMHAVFLAAHALTLRAFTGQDRIIVGSPATGRLRPEVEETVGFFATTTLLDVDLAEAETFADALGQAAKSIHNSDTFKSLPMEILREKLVVDGQLDGNVPFQTFLISHATAKQSKFRIADQDWEMIDLHNGSCKFDLTLELIPSGGGYEVTAEFDVTRYSTYLIELYFDTFLEMLKQIAHASDVTLEAVSTPIEDKTQALLTRLNKTTAPRSDADLVLARFEDSVRQFSTDVAIASPHETWSYCDLDEASRRFAENLRRRGIGTGDLVAVELDREPLLIAAMLGIWRLGAVYLPLDPYNLPERTDIVLNLAKPSLIVSRNAHASFNVADPHELTSGTVETAEVDELPSASDTAYVIFTSGSTGTPKGVCIRHGNLANFLSSMAHQPGLTSKDRLLSVTTPSFDISLLEFLLPLCVGACVEMAPQDIVSDVFELRAFIEQCRPTVMQATPSLWQMLVTSGWRADSTLRILVGGEPLPLSLAQALTSTGAECWNMYGPTETTIWSLCCKVEPSDTSISIGAPIDNTSIRIIDDLGRQVPIGVTGELWIGGAGLAAGYKDRPDLTDKQFVSCGEPAARWYKTGDRVCLTWDGNIVFKGRQDNQLKIRGHRVELGDIETSLIAHPEVSFAVIRPQEVECGNVRLTAFIEPVIGTDTADLHPRLVQYTTEHLPDYMRPARWRFVEAFPKNSAGKIDRAALDGQELASANVATTTQAPETGTELSLAAILQHLLSLKTLDRHADFFAIGGHSLLAVEYLVQVRAALGVKVLLKDLLRNPTIASLASHIDEGQAAGDLAQIQIEHTDFGSLRHVSQPDIDFPLTDVQRAYWSGRQLGANGAKVSSFVYQEFESRSVDLKRLENAWNRLIKRQDMLRAIVTQDGQQRILSDVSHYPIPVEDLSSTLVEVREEKLQHKRARLRRGCETIDTWPLFSLEATVLPDGMVRLHFGIDLLIADAASLSIIAEELILLYEEQDVKLTPLPFSFKDHVLASQHAVKKQDLAAAECWWDASIATFPAGPELPTRDDQLALQSTTFRRRSHCLNGKNWAALRSSAQRIGVSATSLLLSAFSHVLGRWSRTPEFALNLTVFNRPRVKGADTLIGDFTDILLLPVDLKTVTSVRSAALQIQDRLWEALDHAALSGVRVTEKLIRAGRLRAPLPVVFTSLLDQPKQDTNAAISALGIETVYTISQTPQVWLDHQVMEKDGCLYLNWDAVEELFDARILDEMFASYVALLEGLALDPTLLEAADLPRLPAVALPVAESALPVASLHDGLARYAVETPEAVAIWQADAKGGCAFEVSYDQLHRAANKVATVLRAGGLAREEFVAIIMDKGWEQSAAAHGILRAGGAYLPIDPEVPPQRRAELLAAAGVRQILTQPWHLGSLQRDLANRPGAVETPVLQALDISWQCHDAPFAEVVATPDQTAYVIFTSGSTGSPKGVVIAHQAVMNTIEDICVRRCLTSNDGVFGLSSLSFDLSVFDLFGTSARGARLVLPHPDGLKDPRHWGRVLRAAGVTVWNSVPALLRMLVAHEQDSEAAFPELRVAMLSGDWIPLSLPEQAWQSLNSDLEIISLGGATEASIWSIEYPIETVDPTWQSIPYGTGLTNQPMRVVGHRLDECPTGVIGEIVIAGVGLAKGYLGRPDLTEQSFVTHADTGERLYKTGDLGRYTETGLIEFLGRKDTQVKVNGYRIELGEIETILERHPDIAQAVVVPTEASLMAFVSPENQSTPTKEVLGSWVDYLRNRLPVYMVPRALIPIETLPVTRNGKVDRKALAAKAISHTQTEEKTMLSTTTVSAGNAIQKKLMNIVADVLNRDRVGLDDNFFDLGGGSIEIVLIHRQLEGQFDTEIQITDLFRLGTIRRVADHLSNNADPSDQITSVKAQAKTRGERRKEVGRRRRSSQKAKCAVKARNEP
ncbi:amino acid adenylation domain-containing protein [Pseudovibrio denitrificans]|uniref:Amino acid adenylation domain-containing protein n=2 Tax=Pseudovibrio denitrificans TaxID=258256 RepID=A0A1I7DUU7_9HYPH|nr:non-ribosomal peptide synthetase [Pseudovibrio denitrificans]SFU15439.1 amino acid adenylation domain-containing protein [Pseudovibrio denitrificans]